jgi:hypothetical protein
MNIIFQINGGIGKCIAATAVCAAIKAKYPDSQLIVVSGYPEVYLKNPNVYRAFAFGQQQYFYQEYIENKEFMLFAHDPYLVTEHIKSEEHLIETWCKLFGLKVTQMKGSLYLTKREIDFFKVKFNSDRPIFLLHTNGGGQTDLKYSWARDMPRCVAEAVIEKYHQQYNIVHIKREDQLGFDKTHPVSDNFRGLLVLIMLSEKRLLIDSFAQHAAAAIDKPSTVLWIANKPNVFGYDIHTNIVANKESHVPELRNSYLSKYNIGGDLVEFPYSDETEIFNMQSIFDALEPAPKVEPIPTVKIATVENSPELRVLEAEKPVYPLAIQEEIPEAEESIEWKAPEAPYTTEGELTP